MGNEDYRFLPGQCMDKGNVAESGSHEELLAGGGVYAKLWDTQQSLENYRNTPRVYLDGHSAGTEGRNRGKDGAVG